MEEQPFPKKDRELFQVLIANQLNSMEELVAVAGATSPSTLRRQINEFCDKYRCGVRSQILDWERIGLQSFFTLSSDPIDHPYAVRQYKMMGNAIMYLTQLVTPDLNQIPIKFTEVYPISRIYRPTNNITLLYDEARPMSFNEEWLLNLKEIMVDQEMGDILVHQASDSEELLQVDLKFLEQLSIIYSVTELGRFKVYKQIEFIQNLSGFVSTYLDIQLPRMENYILIFDKTTEPHLFVGGFFGRFPITELYETPNALICRFQVPELNFGKLNLELFTHLREICVPYLWVLLEDKRTFNLQEQWINGQWIQFE